MTDHRPGVREALEQATKLLMVLYAAFESAAAHPEAANKQEMEYWQPSRQAARIREQIDTNEAALSAPPIEPVVEEVVEVSQLGFCSARLRDMGLTSSDRIRVVGWTTEAQGGV